MSEEPKKCKSCNAELIPQRTKKGEWRMYCNLVCQRAGQYGKPWDMMYHVKGALPKQKDV